MSDIFDAVLGYSSSDSQVVPTTTTAEVVKPLTNAEKFLLNVERKGFKMDQMRDVLLTDGNQLIVSIAGSGKTTALVFKINYDVVSGRATKLATVGENSYRVLDNIWVCTFLKSGADELRASVRKWQHELGIMSTSDQMSFSTLHAEFKQSLTALGIRTDVVDAKANTALLKKCTTKLGIYGVNGKALSNTEVRDLEGALTRTRNMLKSNDDRYVGETYSTLNLNSVTIDALLYSWREARVHAGVNDFEDFQDVLYDLLYVRQDANALNYVRNKYAYIYVDEFQDTSEIQYEILKEYGSGCKGVIAIGDDDQTIYSWRGSCNRIITSDFAKDFNPIINKLSVNYRCPSNVLNAIKPSIESNLTRFEKDITAARDGGTNTVIKANNYSDMTNNLVNRVTKDVANGNSVAILVRTNADGLMPAIMLELYSDIQSMAISGMGMTFDSPMAKGLVKVGKLFTGSSDDVTKSVLGLFGYDVGYEVANILKVCKHTNKSIWNLEKEDLTHSCPVLGRRLATWGTLKEKYGEVYTLRVIYEDLKTNVYARDTQYNLVCRSIIDVLLLMLDSYKPDDKVKRFLRELDNIGDSLKAKKGLRHAKVKIATIHEYKGKESDCVYVWNDSQGTFPHANCDLNDIEELEEERRVHYIACTRAKKDNTILTIKGKEGMFLNEMDLSSSEVIESSDEGLDLSTTGRTTQLMGGLSYKEYRGIEEDDDDDEGVILIGV